MWRTAMPDLHEMRVDGSTPSLSARAPGTEVSHLQRTVTEIFDEQARRTPGAVAVVYEGVELTYQELNRRSNQFAHYLRSVGVREGDRVGICVERSLQMITGLLGILKAGAAYVPLDPSYPKERLEFMAHNAELRLLLVQKSLAQKVALSGVRPLLFEKVQPDIEKQSKEEPATQLTSEYPAYLIYTSGSTGTPKGVCICHRNIVRLVVNTNYADMGPDQVFLQFAPISFDAATFEIWGALLNGGRLVIFPAGNPSAEELGEWLACHDVTTLWLTAGLFHQMMDADPGHPFRHLRQLLAGGDVLSVRQVHKFLKEYPDCRLINGYGPTENTTFSTCGELREMPEDAHSVTIGSPIANSTAYVLDDEMRPVPSGERGELYLGGNGLAHGYWNDPALTAKRFVPNPFVRTPGDRLYRSGDLARFLPDGNLEFTGRIDNQVKLRGFRIELGEIEAVLAQHAEIAQVAAILREDDPGDKSLVAYVVAQSHERPKASELRAHLRKRLPEYMVPSAFVFLEKLPLTPNGKVDRKALPVSNRDRSTREDSYVAPATASESRLCAIWAEVLHTNRVGAIDNFFDLGGDSLLASRILSRVRKEFGVLLPLHAFFQQPVVSHVARVLELAQKENSGIQLPSVGTTPKDEEIPLGCSQERVWFLQQLDPASIAYHFQATLHISGPLKVEALERSLTMLVFRHEILRTTFIEKDGRAIQIIHEPFPVSLPVIQVQEVDKARLKETTDQLIKAEITRRFDVGRLPLIRWVLFSLGEDEHLLLHVEHHLIHDGWSFNNFLGELFELYQCHAAGRASELPAPALQFADFAVWQQRVRHSEAMQAQLSYWKYKLSGSPPMSALPTDYIRPRIQTFTGGLFRIPLSLELSKAIRWYSQEQEVSLFVVMMSAFFALMYCYTRQADFCVGSSVANRQRAETEGLLGMLVNNVVLRFQVAANESFLDLLALVRDLTFQAYENQDIPFQDVVRGMNANRDLSVNPLFQTTFNFHNSPVGIPDIPEWRLKLEEGVGNGGAKFDLGVIVIPSTEQRLRLNPEWDKDTVVMLWEYNTDLFDETTVQRLTRHYVSLLQTMIGAPRQRVAEVCLLTDAERVQVLREWNDTTAEYPEEPCVHELFEAQALKTPQAIAVACDGKELNYGELNRRANQLAHHLRSRGVRPDARVAVLVNRSLEMIIGLVAILKAGGAYVPLDPAYPLDRLRYMLEDSAPAVMLTQGGLLQKFRQFGDAFPTIDLAAEAMPWSGQPETNPERDHVGLASGHLAYVIYTSGSTGAPKGVAVAHRNLNNLIEWHRNAFSLQGGHRCSSVAGFGFDAATWEIWPALCAGATLLMPATEESDDAERLLAWWQQQKLDISFLPTPMAEFAFTRDLNNDQLQILLVGGDRLRYLPEQRWGFSLINNYGPTETTVVATSLKLQSSRRVLSIGRPIANARIYILHELEPVPIGAVGELYVGGAGVARGYLDRPELTAERFVPNPFSEEAGARMYKTGDLGRWLMDGTIDFLGRNDFQVKIRGFRIELGEIEARLAEYDGIGEALVTAREDSPRDKRLVAYYTCTGTAGKDQPQPAGPQGGLISAEQLRAHLAARLPAYMVPAAYVRMDSLPLTANGKLDRKALPPPDASSYAARQYEAPQGDAETTLAAIFEEVLKVERVGRHDNFFDMGGHSLLATKLISRIRSLIGVELSIQSVFEFPSVAALAPIVEKSILDEITQMPETEAAQIADLLSDR
jgi:amino acid adenylation domain-containing protein